MILVTGASGLLGANLVRALLEANEQVRCFVNSDTRALDRLDVDIQKGDIRNYGDVIRAVKGVDLAFHLAGLISLDGDREVLESVNVLGVRNVVKACLESGVRRLVHFSSIHAISSKPDSFPVTEDNARVNGKQAAPYDLSKALGEREVWEGIEKGVDAVILNPTGVIGPFDHKPSMFGQALIMIARGTFPVLVQGGFNWVDARDVAICALDAAANAPSGSQFIVGGEWHSVEDIAEVTANMYGQRPPILYAPGWLASAGLPLSNLYSMFTGKRNIFTGMTLDALSSNPLVDDSRVRSTLGYRSRAFEETIQDAVLWFAAHGMLPPLPQKKGNPVD